MLVVAFFSADLAARLTIILWVPPAARLPLIGLLVAAFSSLDLVFLMSLTGLLRGGVRDVQSKTQNALSVWFVVALGTFRRRRGPTGLGAFVSYSMFRRRSVVRSMFRRCAWYRGLFLWAAGLSGVPLDALIHNRTVAVNAQLQARCWHSIEKNTQATAARTRGCREP